MHGNPEEFKHVRILQDASEKLPRGYPGVDCSVPEPIPYICHAYTLAENKNRI